MKAAIEQIVSCDEGARASVQKARAEAEKIIRDAREKARNMRAEFEKKLDDIRGREIDPIIKQARQEALTQEEQADQYIERLREMVSLEKETIVDDFLKETLGIEITLDAVK